MVTGEISPEDQQQLLALARRALEARVRGTRDSSVEVSTVEAGALNSNRGAFVSVFCRGDLRGCLGRLQSNVPLSQTVFQLAQRVADSDSRFAKITRQELGETTLEISVLTPEREIASVSEIEVGRHGLIVEQGSARGLLLPQVPAEHGWDRDTFLDQVCIKAGLSPDAWRRGARLFVFEAHVFGERTHG